ncbi:UNKNOWN [Stylonychia lemnae]|uniref:Uncharacterized protein n=1 Tax=Stylonychia lemnae TaxID=5949 RepID=A0A078ATN4_STYLE|nr:UNKNOWN [Stylonychia lemnae]|eukprot:CDW84577.1 UNKNOWN [Stylonychia lemnae]
MKKFITIAGALMLGSVVATEKVLNEAQLVHALEHDLIAAEQDVSLIKDHLQGIMKRRSRSADPRVERSSSWSKIHHATGALNDLTQAGVAIYGATQIPHVERGFSLHKLGHATGIAGDLVNIGTSIYGATQYPQVERGISLHNLGHATGIAGDLVNIGTSIYGATQQPHVERGISLHNLGHATGIAGDLVNIGTSIYGAVHQPHVERGISLHNLGHATGIASDLVNMGTSIYGATQMPHVEKFKLNSHNLGHIGGIATDLAGIGLNIYGATQIPHVEGWLGALGEATGIAGDLVGMGTGIYGAVHHVQAMPEDEEDDDIEVEAFRSGSRSSGRTSTYKPMHPIDIAQKGSQIISGLGETGAGMYNQIMQGQAAAAQKAYYEQQMNQPHVEQYWDGPVYVRPTRYVYNIPAGGVIYPHDE